MGGLYGRGRWAAVLSVVAFVTACGGGGGGGSGGTKTLYLSMNYGDTTVNVWQPASLNAQISGLEGNPPTCAVVAGRLPAGMALQGDCRIAGTPEDAGITSATIRITVRNFEGQVDTPIAISVVGPSTSYVSASAGSIDRMTLGSPQAATPGRAAGGGYVNWAPQAGQSLSYRVAEGALPAGLVLDAASGALSGVPSAPGSWRFGIEAVARQGAASVTSSSSYTVNVVLPDISVAFENLRKTPYAVGDTVSAIPTVRFGSGVRAADYQVSYSPSKGATTLPAGLALNLQTGEIGGKLTGPVDSPRGDAVEYAQSLDVKVATRGVEFSLPGAYWTGSVTPPPLAPGAGFKPAPAAVAGSSVMWHRLYAPTVQNQFANRMTVLDRLASIGAPTAATLSDTTSFNFGSALDGTSFTVFVAPERTGAPRVWNQATVAPRQPLAAGLYLGTVASDAPLRLAPTLAAGCEGSGAFKVHEVALGSDGKPTRIAIDYVQTCNGYGGSTVMGAIRHNSTVPLALDEVYAVAGRDGDVLEGTAITLDARASWSPVSPVIETRWRQLSGPAFDLAGCEPGSATCATYVPLVAAGGDTAVFELQVNTLAGRAATTRLTLRIRSTAERQSLVQQRDANARLATTTGPDLRFSVPTMPGTESIYRYQRADHFYVQALGSRPGDPLTVADSIVAVLNPNAQPFAPPQDLSGTGAAYRLDLFGSEFASGVTTPGCNSTQWQLALAALTRDPADATVVRNLAAWFSVSCPTGEPLYSRFWIDYQPVTPPTARASGPATAPRGAAYTLGDAGSTSPLGPLKARLWTQVYGTPAKTVAKMADGSVQVTPADNTPDGARLVFVLEVVDARGQPALAMVRTTISGGPAALRVDGQKAALGVR